jgi:hypothetical protein
MPAGRGSDVSCAEPGAWLGVAPSALDAAAGQRGGGAGPGLLLTARGGPEPGGGAGGLPGGAPQGEGGLGPGDGAVLGALTPGHRDQVARAIAIAPVQGARFMEAQSPAGEGGAGDAMVPGRHGLAEAVDLWEAEAGWEPRCRLGAQACQGLPGACEDLVSEASQGAATEAPGAWCEAIALFALQDVGLPWVCGDESR